MNIKTEQYHKKMSEVFHAPSVRPEVNIKRHLSELERIESEKEKAKTEESIFAKVVDENGNPINPEIATNLDANELLD